MGEFDVCISELLASTNFGVYNRFLAHKLGLINAVVLCELFSEYKYFRDNQKLVDGSFYSTIENLEKNTALNDYYQRKALNDLKSQNLIEVFQKGIPAKRYIRLNLENIYNLFRTDLRTRSANFKEQDPDTLQLNDHNYKDNNNISSTSKDVSSISGQTESLRSSVISSQIQLKDMPLLFSEKKSDKDTEFTQEDNNKNKINNIDTLKERSKTSDGIFAVPKKEDPMVKAKKDSKYIQQWEYIAKKYNFSKEVKHLLDIYFTMLVETKTILGHATIDFQLQHLSKCSNPEKAVEMAISRGQKSLDYAIADVDKMYLVRGPYEKPKEIDNRGNTISTSDPHDEMLREIAFKADDIRRSQGIVAMCQYRKECIANGLCTEEEFPES